MDTATLTQAGIQAGADVTLDYSNDAGNTAEADITLTNATAAWSGGDTVFTITLNDATDSAFIPDGKYVGVTADGTVANVAGTTTATDEIYSAQVAKESDAPTYTVVGTSVNAAGDTIAITFNETMDATTLTQAAIRAGNGLTLDYSNNAGNTCAVNLI